MATVVAKSQNAQRVTYAFTSDRGEACTVTVLKKAGRIEFTVLVVPGSRTWQQFCADAERDMTFV